MVSDQAERAVLVAVDLQRGGLISAEESIEELASLAATAGLNVVAKVVQSLKQANPRTLVGTGKIEEIGTLVDRLKADVVLFDDELTPVQQRNLEQAFCRKVVDRTQLILDIFAQRATTQEGKLQVELAQLEYLKPRLTRQWLHLSRQRGGVGTRGPGETQLEVDRRSVRDRIGRLRRRLAQVQRTRGLHRIKRAKVPYPIVALVGYTNAGKSTLMNCLTQAGTLVENRLFATLDPTIRLLRVPGGSEALLVDTVGFIHKLPHGFVDAFKSTLEEVANADLLLHVVDGSSETAEEQIQVVEGVLAELGAAETPCITVFNKVDKEPVALRRRVDSASCSISARNGTGVENLLSQIAVLLAAQQEKLQVNIPFSRRDLVAALHRSGRVVSEDVIDEGYRVVAYVPQAVAGRVRKELKAAC